jgi:hypothetical protein
MQINMSINEIMNIIFSLLAIIIIIYELHFCHKLYQDIKNGEGDFVPKASLVFIGFSIIGISGALAASIEKDMDTFQYSVPFISFSNIAIVALSIALLMAIDKWHK